MYKKAKTFSKKKSRDFVKPRSLLQLAALSASKITKIGEVLYKKKIKRDEQYLSIIINSSQL